MKFIENCQDTCYIERLIDVPGNTSEEIKENFLKRNYEVLDTIDIQIDALESNLKRLDLLNEQGDVIWESEEPDVWDPYDELQGLDLEDIL